MSTTSKAVLEQANAALKRGDHEGFLAHCTEDVVWVFVGDQTLKGKPAVRKYMQEAYVEPPVFHIERLIAEGDYLTALGEITLRDETGRSTRYAACDVWRLRDGKLAELRAYVVEISRG